MPIETGMHQVGPADETIGAAYLAQAQSTLRQSLRKIEHCVTQLDDADLWWRDHPSHNSIQNVVLHLCGNLRQWIGHGVGGEPDTRNRPLEFSDRQPLSRDELMQRLTAAVTEAVTALGKLPASRLLEPQRIQGFDCTLLTAIFDTVSHFVGHTHQIVYITRLRRGDKYHFQWVPAGIEQGGPPQP